MNMLCSFLNIKLFFFIVLDIFNTSITYLMFFHELS